MNSDFKKCIFTQWKVKSKHVFSDDCKFAFFSVFLLNLLHCGLLSLILLQVLHENKASKL